MALASKYKHKKVRVFYTNKKRVETLTALGAEPIPGFIKNPVVVGRNNVVFLYRLKSEGGKQGHRKNANGN